MKKLCMHNFFWRNTVYGISQWIEKSSRIYLHNQAVKEGLEIGIEQGLEQGREEGKLEGIEKEKLETVRRLKSQGIDSNIIAQATLLSIEEIEKI